VLVSESNSATSRPLAGRVTVVTGANGVIGSAIVHACAREGAKLVLAGRTADALSRLAECITRDGGTALPVPTDVTAETDVCGLFSTTLDTFGRVDVLVNAAGRITTTPIDSASLVHWQDVLNVNLTGAFLCGREAFKTMKRQREGRIINIGSISAIVPRADSVAYTTSKWALAGLTRSLALDGRPYGITASIVHPGLTLLPTAERRSHLGSVLDPSDVAQVVVLMASLSPHASLCEATILPIDQPSFLGRG
jgi:NAD(P)-dependent dehydrogenase (short-subunit alcohol dehydrogenase family)